MIYAYQNNSKIKFRSWFQFETAEWYMLTDKEGKARIKQKNLVIEAYVKPSLHICF